MGMIYAEVGGVNQLDTDETISNPPDGYVKVAGDKPPGFFIGQDDGDGLGSWVAGMTPDQDKMNGVSINYVMCSATESDQDGVNALYNYVKNSGNSSTFKMANGNEIELTPANFDAFYTTWSAFRETFF